MTKDIPKMDDLIKGINDPDMLLTDELRVFRMQQTMTCKRKV